jgi:uncharacterized membrane protein YkvI
MMTTRRVALTGCWLICDFFWATSICVCDSRKMVQNNFNITRAFVVVLLYILVEIACKSLNLLARYSKSQPKWGGMWRWKCLAGRTAKAELTWAFAYGHFQCPCAPAVLVCLSRGEMEEKASSYEKEKEKKMIQSNSIVIIALLTGSRDLVATTNGTSFRRKRPVQLTSTATCQ